MALLFGLRQVSQWNKTDDVTSLNLLLLSLALHLFKGEFVDAMNAHLPMWCLPKQMFLRLFVSFLDLFFPMFSTS